MRFHFKWGWGENLCPKHLLYSADLAIRHDDDIMLVFMESAFCKKPNWLEKRNSEEALLILFKKIFYSRRNCLDLDSSYYAQRKLLIPIFECFNEMCQLQSGLLTFFWEKSIGDVSLSITFDNLRQTEQYVWETDAKFLWIRSFHNGWKLLDIRKAILWPGRLNGKGSIIVWHGKRRWVMLISSTVNCMDLLHEMTQN